MEKEGFEYLADNQMPAKGDVIIVPSIATYVPVSQEIKKGLELINTTIYRTSCPIRTMHNEEKAGFYSHGWGFLTYAFTKNYLEEFKIYKYNVSCMDRAGLISDE